MHATILKKSAVHVADAGAPHPPALLRSGTAQCTSKPKAMLVEHAGRPVAIQVTCGCGVTTTVELEFPADVAGKNNAEKKP
jgi:hypothetical protein